MRRFTMVLGLLLGLLTSLPATAGGFCLDTLVDQAALGGTAGGECLEMTVPLVDWGDSIIALTIDTTGPEGRYGLNRWAGICVPTFDASLGLGTFLEIATVGVVSEEASRIEAMDVTMSTSFLSFIYDPITKKLGNTILLWPAATAVSYGRLVPAQLACTSFGGHWYQVRLPTDPHTIMVFDLQTAVTVQ